LNNKSPVKENASQNKEGLSACCQKSLKVSLAVGTLLSAINQGGVLLDQSVTTKDLIRILFNYLVPLAVATYSRLALLKELE